MAVVQIDPPLSQSRVMASAVGCVLAGASSSLPCNRLAHRSFKSLSCSLMQNPCASLMSTAVSRAHEHLTVQRFCRGRVENAEHAVQIGMPKSHDLHCVAMSPSRASIVRHLMHEAWEKQASA